MPKWLLRSLLLLVFLESSIFAQILPFRNYTSRDGLLSNYTLALCNDSLGYLWIGSNDGLTRYDGISFVNYTVADGLAFSRVTCLRESRKHPGILWMGTNGGGVSKFENGRFTTYPVGSSTWSNSISSIEEDYAGRIWVATSRGIFICADSFFVRLPMDFPKTDLFAVLACPDSSVWIETDHQIYSCSAVTHAAHIVPIIPARNSVFESWALDANGSLWIAVSDGQVLKVRGETIVERIHTGSKIHDFITPDAGDVLWVGIEGGVLRISSRKRGFASRQMKRYSLQNGLQDEFMIAGAIDHEGDLWLGSSSHGITKLSDYSIVTYPIHPLFYMPNNSTALNDVNDHVWVCSDSGLLEYWNDVVQGWKSFRHAELDKGKRNNYPVSICLDQDQTLWVVRQKGTINGYRVRRYVNGASRLTQSREFKPGRQFPNAIPMFLFCDDNGLLWCSMSNDHGIFLLNPQKRSPFLRQYTVADGMPDMSVRAIYEDRQGNLWFGGYSDGLAMLPSDESLTGHLKLFTTDQGLPNNAIRAIAEDSLGTLWVGTRYGGLAYFRDSLFHPVSLNEGLLSTAVWCIARGLHNQLWIGTQMGMQSMTPASHTFSDNLNWDNDPVYACGQTSQSILWFVSTAGLALHDASRDRDNTVPPPVLVEHFEVNGVSFPTSGSFELSSGQDNCTIEVAGVSLRDEGSLQYQYRLLGTSSDEWRSPNKNRTFVFASLAPGSYTFMARAVNASGLPSIRFATLQFTILPPFWKHWWFIAGSALFLAFVAAFIVRLRLTRLLAIERLRSGIATDLHDDVGSGLTRIAILSDVAYTQLQSGQKHQGSSPGDASEVLGALEKVRTTARGLIETMSDVVWAIDPTHDTFERLVQRLRSFAFELCEGKNIKLRFHSTDEAVSNRMSSEGLRNVLLLSKEALTNIAKHSQCTSAEVSLSVTGQQLIIRISDDGRGFDPSVLSSGNGLGNMRKRTRLPGSSFELKSTPGKGTQITASFPLSA